MNTNLQFSSILDEVSSITPLYENRRDILIQKMGALIEKKINCFSCSGLCCTFVSNSMQTDPIQTLELYKFLLERDRINEGLITELQDVIRNNRLDNEISTGKGSTFRRTYTCPFYKKGEKGCTISPSHKPYGCLSFNARSPNAIEGSDCGPDFEQLKKREIKHEMKEQLANNFLKEEMTLYWDKKPMPVALLEFIEKLSN